jgi:electron transfer flavoprotein beta subunit
VAALVRGATCRRIGQRETTVDDDPIVAIEVASQSVDVDERSEFHAAIVATPDAFAPPARIAARGAKERSLQTVMVGIKRVVDYNVRVRVKPDGSGMATEGLKTSINPFDEIAIEAALRLKEAGVATEVLIVSVGPSESEQQLRTALAMGADRALRVDAPRSLEPLAVARALHAVALRELPKLVVLGKQAVDDDHGQTGQMLAALWGRPQATFASSIAITGDVATVAREIDAGLETLEIDLPAVITTDLRLNQPRYVKLPEILRAKTKPLGVVSLADLGVGGERQFTVCEFAPPPARGAGVRAKDVAELVTMLNERGALS